MNLKIPAKRIFGDNFDPGMSSSCYSFCQFLYMKIDLFQPTRSYLRWVLQQSSKQWLNQSLVMLQSRAGTSVGRCFTLWWWTKHCLVAPCLPCTEGYSSAQPSHLQDCERFWTVRCDLSPIKAKANSQTLPKRYVQSILNFLWVTSPTTTSEKWNNSRICLWGLVDSLSKCASLYSLGENELLL